MKRQYYNEFTKLIGVMEEKNLDTEAQNSVYLGMIAQYSAIIADALDNMAWLHKLDINKLEE